VDTSYETHKLERNNEMTFREDIKINIASYVVIVEVPELSNEEITQTTLPMLTPPVITTTYKEPEKRSRSVNEELLIELPSPSPIAEHIQKRPLQQDEIQIYHDRSTSSSRSSLSPLPETLSPPKQMSPSDETSLEPPTTDSALLDALLTTLIFSEVKPTPFPRLIADLTNRMATVLSWLIVR
jgi:hypothetical protein